MKEENKKCPCPNLSCPRKCKCEECKKYNKERGIKSFCERK